LRYIEDVFSLNNSRLGDFVDRIYPIELEIKDTTNTDRAASYLDIHLDIDSEGRLRTKVYGKRDDFNFPIVNLPFICSNIPAVLAYGVKIKRITWTNNDLQNTTQKTKDPATRARGGLRCSGKVSSSCLTSDTR